MLKFVIVLFTAGSFCLFGLQEDIEVWNLDKPVQEVLAELGEPMPAHFIKNLDEEKVRKGEELVKYGKTIGSNGRKTKFISKYYVCTTCHNLEQEDPDLRFSNPETRLPYVKEKNMPFLQGTTFKGIVNRESWYNNDYVKKYGDEKIEAAHNNLRESIQLCAIECSQGRSMKDWEIEAVLSYYQSLQFTLQDLKLSATDMEKLNKERTNPTDQLALREWIKSFYLQTSPAHFFDAPADKIEGYAGLIGDPKIGKDIYELSCLYCHKDGGVSHYILDNSKLSFRHLEKMVPKDSHFSLYQIIAYGTYAIPGHKPYMPHYPEERMSKQQVEDLRAYISLKATGKLH